MGFELLLIMIFGLIIFGPEEIPTVVKSVGRVIFEVKKVFNEVVDDVKTTVFDEPDTINKSVPKPITPVVDDIEKDPEA